MQELEALPSTPHVQFMIAEAKAGEYHDYKNQKYACGKVQLHKELRKAGLHDLAARVMNGEFDEEADPGDRERMRQDVIENSTSTREANALIKFLKLGDPVG